jgi:hypothetical protein
MGEVIFEIKRDIERRKHTSLPFSEKFEVFDVLAMEVAFRTS